MIIIRYKRRSRITGRWVRLAAELPDEGARLFLRDVRHSPDFRILRIRRMA